MKKTLFAAAVAALALTGCAKVESVSTISTNEIMLEPVNEAKSIETRGYADGPQLDEIYLDGLHGVPNKYPREMQISAYLYPQNGEEKNYFVDKTYAVGDDKLWHNKVKAGIEPIFWPVGGKMDFLAYSLTGELTGPGKSHNVTAVWGADNAADQVILTVPGENSQNDILFASASGVESSKTQKPVRMQFDHAQAWLEFVLTGSSDPLNPDGIVTLKRIELEDVYNAGKLVISNNKGNAIAKWDFTGEKRQNIEVDNFANVAKLNDKKQFLDMLIPQQEKTAFVIYYTLGSSPKELSYRFTTDQKTWLMGEKYVYIINIKANEVTVAPTVTAWQKGEDEAFNWTVAVETKNEFGKVIVDGLGAPVGTKAGSVTSIYSVTTWGQQAKLTAKANLPGFKFVKWSDDNTDNPRTISVTSDIELSAVFSDEGDILVTGESLYEEIGTVSGSRSVNPGATVILTATPADSNWKFFRWLVTKNSTEALETTSDATVMGNVLYYRANKPMKFYAQFIPNDAIPGAFNISETRQVVFAKGNLQADITGSPVQWSFADNQYDIIGMANVSGENLAGKIDLFGWSGNSLYGISTSKTDSDYGNKSFRDWGNNFGMVPGIPPYVRKIWRTPTGHNSGEFNYLFNVRNGASIPDCGNVRYVKGIVDLGAGNGRRGVFLFPDGMKWPSSVTNKPNSTIVNNKDAEYPSYVVSVNEFNVLQNAGVVFLPSAGQRRGVSIDLNTQYQSYMSSYWSSTAPGTDSNANPRVLFFYRADLRANHYDFKYSGNAVRLVYDIINK